MNVPKGATNAGGRGPSPEIYVESYVPAAVASTGPKVKARVTPGALSVPFRGREAPVARLTTKYHVPGCVDPTTLGATGMNSVSNVKFPPAVKLTSQNE